MGRGCAFGCSPPRAAMAVCDELQPDKQYVAQIKRKGRSLDANAYAWVLLDKLAAHYGIPRNDVYREEIKIIGGVSDVLCIVSEAADEFCRKWESKGTGWLPFFRASPVLPPPPVLFGFLLVLSSNFHIFGTKR